MLCNFQEIIYIPTYCTYSASKSFTSNSPGTQKSIVYKIFLFQLTCTSVCSKIPASSIQASTSSGYCSVTFFRWFCVDKILHVSRGSCNNITFLNVYLPLYLHSNIILMPNFFMNSTLACGQALSFLRYIPREFPCI